MSSLTLVVSRTTPEEPIQEISTSSIHAPRLTQPNAVKQGISAASRLLVQALMAAATVDEYNALIDGAVARVHRDRSATRPAFVEAYTAYVATYRAAVWGSEATR